MSNHTPGPWNLVKRKNNEVKIEHTNRHTKGASSLTIAKVTVCDSWFTEQMANAHLIWAAPDLLEALCKLAQLYDAMGAPRGPCRIIADAAIAKATGEE